MRFACVLVLLLTISCGTAQAPDSTTTQTAAQTPTAAPAPTAAAAVTPPASPPRSPIVNPNQEVNDRIMQQVLTAIAGRENEPAENVFKNIQSMKGMPAGRLVRVMNLGYSRALGVACMHCHVEGNFASDDQRPKRAARDMMAMNRMINEQLKAMKNLEGQPEEIFVSCTTCHRGRIDPNAGLR